jgi:multimeric flavodoxin WrbA
MNDKKFKILTILGSPHDLKSNTRALVEDFVSEIATAGLELDHEIIPLGRKNIKPCKGCWACTKDRPCPLADDDLMEVKKAMIACDMLILASPVYTNQVTAQMKTMIDRLFTWCHVFPLLGKYSLSVVTTGNDGHEETGEFLEKMLATYGTNSFGSIHSIGGLTPGFFPWRAKAKKKHSKFAKKVAKTVLLGRRPKRRAIQREIFKVMRKKMVGIHSLNCLKYGVPEGQPKPPRLRLKIMRYFINKVDVTEKQMEKWAKLLSFELKWWRDRGWLRAKSMKQLTALPIPEGFNADIRLMGSYGLDKMINHELKN